jgi:2-phospho-L-lactate/phosphoenolpyruvate guanylyltransferase
MSAELDAVRIAGRLPQPGAPQTALGERAVLVPIKAFADAKRRLGGALSDQEREQLVRAMAARVLAAAAPLPVAVVCDDAVVASWARERGALVVWEPGRGLNGAVEAGVDHLSQMGVRRVVVAHGDLPRATGLADLGPFDGITLVPDRHGDGTNVIELPTGCGFHFSYGPGSFDRHRAESLRVGQDLRVLHVPDLAHDVDWPDDLVAGVRRREAGAVTSAAPSAHATRPGTSA